jgi:hypothetical protein
MPFAAFKLHHFWRTPMNRLLISFAACAVLLSTSPSFAANRPSAQQCSAWFNKMDRNGDGTLSNGENARRFTDKITLATTDNGGDGDTTMGRAFFLAECKVGSFGMP